MDEKLKDKKISAISLGCDKNRVDLEKMLFRLKKYGFEIVDDVTDANIVVINTCAFISPARKEALDNIFEMCLRKNGGKLEKVVVSGCLAQRYAKDLEKQIPEIDAILSAKDNERICEIVEDLYGVKHKRKSSEEGRIFTSRGSYAYLKIAEGCNNVCSYCTIPRIKGRYTSEPIEKVVEEAKYLAKNGVREIILVAQDVTRYGEDLYGENKLIELCKKIAKIDGVEWIRLHYLYPEKTTDELLSYMKKEKKMCKYLDIPLQHIDDTILKSMRRHLGEKKTRDFVQKLHTDYENFAIRTTFIVGYPGEKKKEFKKLCEFVLNEKFKYAGFFPFYKEENTPSFYMKGQVPNLIKKLRFKKIQKLQNKVASQNAKEMIDKTYKVLVDYFDQNTGDYVGHTEFFSPTVDFGVEIEDNGNINIGEFVNVKFVDFDGQNFKGVCDESTK